MSKTGARHVSLRTHRLTIGLVSAAILALGPLYAQAVGLMDPDFSTVIETDSGPFTDAEQFGWHTASPGEILTGGGLVFNTFDAAGTWQVVAVNPSLTETLSLTVGFSIFDVLIPGDVLWEVAVTGFSDPSFSAGQNDPATLAGLGLGILGSPATGTTLASYGSASPGVVTKGSGTASIPFTYPVGTDYLLVTAYAENANFASSSIHISSIAIPEPGATVLGGIAVLSLLAVRRRSEREG